MFGRLTLSFIVVSIVAFFCARSVEATKGPKITNRLYFDIKHGDEDLGRSMCLQTHAYRQLTRNTVTFGVFGGVCLGNLILHFPDLMVESALDCSQDCREFPCLGHWFKERWN